MQPLFPIAFDEEAVSRVVRAKASDTAKARTLSDSVPVMAQLISPEVFNGHLTSIWGCEGEMDTTLTK